MLPPRLLAKPLVWLTLLLVSFPLFLLGDFLGYILEARLHLGHWPHSANPDPKQLGWWMQHGALQLGFLGFPIVSLAGVIVAIIGRVRSPDFPVTAIVITAILSVAALLTYARIDPGGFLGWFWD